MFGLRAGCASAFAASVALMLGGASDASAVPAPAPTIPAPAPTVPASSVPAAAPPAPWTTPAAVSLGGGLQLGAPSGVASGGVFSPSGAGVVLVSEAGPAAEGGRMLFARIAANGIPGTLGGLSRAADLMGSTASLAFPGADTVIGVGTVGTRGARAWIASAGIGQALGRVSVLPVVQGATQAVVAGDAGGDVAVLVRTCGARVAGCADGRVYLLVRRSGQGFGRAMLVGDRVTNAPIRVVIPAAGRVLAFWSAAVAGRGGLDGQVKQYARSARTASGRAATSAPGQAATAGVLGRPQALGSATDEADLSVAVTPSGETIVGWGLQQPRRGCPSAGAAIVDAAVAGPGAGFGPTTQVDRWAATDCDETLGSPGVVAVAGAGSSGLLAWEDFDGQNERVRTAAVNGGLIETATYATDPGLNSTLDDLTAGPGGTPYLLWSYPGQSNALIGGFVSASGFTGREFIASGPIVGPTVSYDQLTQRILATWTTNTVPTSIDYAVRIGP